MTITKATNIDIVPNEIANFKGFFEKPKIPTEASFIIF